MASFLLALVASLVLLFAPLAVQGEEAAVSPSGSAQQRGPSEPRISRRSLLADEGWHGALPLSIPLLLTGAGMVAARLRARPILVAIAVVLGALVVVAALSVGIYYVPAEAAMIVAGVKERRT